MIQDKDFASMASKLQIPHVVSDIFTGDSALTDEVEFGIHEEISDMQPDSALLAIALSADIVTSYYNKASPSMQVLSIECKRVLEEYAPLWIRNALGNAVDERDILDLLESLAEDLQSLEELLELNSAFLKAKDPVAAKLFRILEIQAEAQSLIAEEFLNMAKLEDRKAQTQDVSIPTAVASQALSNDNIIAFPKGGGI